MLLHTALRHLGAGWWPVAIVALAFVLGDSHSASAQDVVATINGEKLSQAEFYGRLQRVKAGDFIVNTNPPGMRSENAGYIILNSIINERLILQLAEKEMVTPTQAEIDVDLGPLMKQESVIKAIADHLVAPEELKYDVTVQKARYNLATMRQQVTPAEIDAFYNAHIDSYKSPERWDLSAIRTTKVDDAVKITDALKAGKSFEETARTYSEDERTKALGGKIGTFDATDKSLPEDIRRAVRDLKAGQFTSPIGVQFDTGSGKMLVYWIVKLTEKHEANQRQLADVRLQVERLAALQKVGGLDVADKKIAAFRKIADIKINLPGYEQLLSAPVKQ